MTQIFDFDSVIDRKNWDSVKWSKYADRDVLPFWVADMDFATPYFIIDAVRERLEHPILGYTSAPQDLEDAFVAWIARQFNWAVDPEWVIPITAVVPGLNLSVRSVGSEGDQCLIPVPVYPPFLEVPVQSHRRGVYSSLVLENDMWQMNFEDIANKAKNCSSLLFCNPQNPTGRVFTESELRKLGSICAETETLLISDEIHWGLVLEPACEHIPIASLASEIANNSITLISHTKTYNVAGLLSAIAVIPNPTLRQRFEVLVERTMPSGSPLSYAAGIAAYNDTSSWVQELTAYLRLNRDLVLTTIDSLSTVEAFRIEGTHLCWLDGRGMGVPDVAAHLERHGLGLSDGTEFGTPGFVRMNFAAPRKLLRQGLDRLVVAAMSSA
ncbi:MAG: putative C-S lyase [Gammaproteobacteria bacterium]|nr:putative C-S lyase [Gammaproteobacteria bacterium]